MEVVKAEPDGGDSGATAEEISDDGGDGRKKRRTKVSAFCQ